MKDSIVEWSIVKCSGDNCMNTVIASVTVQLAFMTLVSNPSHPRPPLEWSHIETESKLLAPRPTCQFSLCACQQLSQGGVKSPWTFGC